MAGPLWGEGTSADGAILTANAASLLSGLLTSASHRKVPDIAMAHAWHRDLYKNVPSVPKVSYLGNPRGSDDPDLNDYEVAIFAVSTGEILSQGVPAADVGRALKRLQASLRQAVTQVDAAVSSGQHPATTEQVLAVVQLASVMHGEWIRIHPYTNGNGGVARIWANWIAMRYGLPPFVRIEPRPDGLLYGQAAQLSMGHPPDFSGDHTMTVSVFIDLLRQRPGQR